MSGSLILGFFDLIYNQAQNRFYNELEEWLSTVTEINDDRSDSRMHFYLNKNIKEMNASLTDFVNNFKQDRTHLIADGNDVLKAIQEQQEVICSLLSEQNKLLKKISDEK